MMSNASSIKDRMRDGKYDERGRKAWLSVDRRSIWQIDSPNLSKCSSAAARSFFVNLSFFGVLDDLGIPQGTIKIGNGPEPAGNGEGGKTRVSTPCRDRQSEQGKG